MADKPDSVGGFELLDKLGSGGFGSVYLGRDENGRQAAVKLLHPHLADDDKVRDLFARELTAARQVQGFCVAEILDADPGAERPWIATEFVSGPTLQQAVAENGPRSGSDLQRLAVQTATALCAIHAAGVVHRDLKPDNIMLAPEGPRVIDFGVARAVEGTAVTSATMVGTAGYMAPEQLEGDRLTSAADVFAWGVVMVFAATGSQAFPGESNMARIARVATGEPVLDGVPELLLPIVRSCLEKRPDDRPSSRDVLDFLLGGAPPPATGTAAVAAKAAAQPTAPAASPPPQADMPSPPPAASHAPQPGARHSVPPGGFASAVPGDTPPPVARGPVLPATDLLAALYDPVAALDRWIAAEKAAGPTDHAVRAEALLGQAEALSELERFAEVDAKLMAADRAMAEQGPPPTAYAARLQLCRATTLLGRGRYSDSDVAFQHAESIARQGDVSLVIARCSVGRGRLSILHGADPITADRYLKDGLEWASRSAAPLLRCEALRERAIALLIIMRSATASNLAEEALIIANQLGSRRVIAESLFVRAIAAAQSGQTSNGEQLARQATELAQELQHVGLQALALSTWAVVAVSLHRNEEAVRGVEHAVSIAERAQDPRVLVETLYSMGRVYRKAGRKHMAKPVVDRATSLANAIQLRYSYAARWERLFSRIRPW
ncbi:serine/threonine protein kinase [Spiractinospora alimapuensis]|uniref:serine/threonine protein kinase n=1 Tax=Spiractinospora alimapuensis TaxID=2820884 RepID=UPI001F33906D|nr:serine/threonine-protein kinase [Spiractinospora alimapuensis]